MLEDQEPEMTPEDIVAMFEDVWPSSNPKSVSFISGVTTTVNIWQFRIEITLTTSPIASGDKGGSARMSFTLVWPGIRAIAIKNAATNKKHVVAAFIRYCLMYMNGVISSIETAGEEKPEAPAADIFG